MYKGRWLFKGEKSWTLFKRMRKNKFSALVVKGVMIKHRDAVLSNHLIR